jgi:invasion protein IalB
MRFTVVTFLFLLFLAQPAQGQSLPGGAGSLSESYQDWQVRCVTTGQGPRCAMSQMQVDPKTRKRILIIELRTDDGKAAGALIAPFGLALASGVTLKIDDRGAEKPFAFSTCLPAGCVVPLDLDAGLTKSLVSGKILTIVVTAADTRQPLSFSISLNGFAAAWARLGDLQEQAR